MNNSQKAIKKAAVIGSSWAPSKKTAIILFSDGSIRYGFGFGAEGISSGEVCFNTSITGYQEIMSDPSYAKQIVNFTFPHIGNVGANNEDIETSNLDKKMHIAGVITHSIINTPSNYRADLTLGEWMSKNKIIGISGIDTRFLTKTIRDQGMMNCVIEHRKTGIFDLKNLNKILKKVKNMEGLDLASDTTTKKAYSSNLKSWEWDLGFAKNEKKIKKVALIDYGIKSNIIRMMNTLNCETKIFPADTDIDTILHFQPDGVLLSNGPGDPNATINYSILLIKEIIKKNIPIFGICLGHQILALALGAKTVKMSFGHHGGNHPVLDSNSKKVFITSMNHGFTVDRNTLPDNIIETHVSLFDGSNCGIEVSNKPIFSVQFHPEASPGPQDCYHLFEKFIENMIANSRKMNNAKKN